MDTKFSVALHILTMISESREDLSSQALATSVGTNASYIRKVLGLLKKAGLIISSQGRSGYQLGKAPEAISLLEIYQATQEVQQIQLFQIHQHANQECPVGKHMEGAMTPIFASVEQELQRKLAEQTLDDVIDNLYKEAKQKRI